MRVMAGLKGVEMMLMKRRLRWLGKVARMKETRIPKCLLMCKPEGGKRSVGGRKMQWIYVILGYLNKCELYTNWREEAQDRSIWRGWIKAAAEDMNEEMEIAKLRRKDELKQRREDVNQEQTRNDWRCSEQGCQFVGISYARLLNHTRQSHSTNVQCRYRCFH